MFIGRKRGIQYEIQRKQAHRGGGNRRITSHNNGFSSFYGSIKTNKKLDCFGSVEPHNDENITNTCHCALVAQSGICHDCEKTAQLAPTSILPHKGGRGSQKRNFSEKVYSRFTSHYSQKYMNSKIAFTLAEVLITLGIIGVVAMMTIPTLVQKYRENVLMAQFKKSYATVANGFRLSEIDNGDMKDWPIGPQMNIEEYWTIYIKPYFNSPQICINENDCGYSYVDRVKWSGLLWSLETNESRILFKLVDGTVIFLPNYTTDENDRPCYVNYFYIDVNGAKKPNKLCYDVFKFQKGTDKGITPIECAAEVIGNNWKIPANYPYQN